MTNNKFCNEVREAFKATRKHNQSYAEIVWQNMPVHHKKVIVMLAVDDCENLKIERKAWLEIEPKHRQSIGVIARHLLEGLNSAKHLY